MKTKLLGLLLLLLAGSSLFGVTRVFVGVGGGYGPVGGYEAGYYGSGYYAPNPPPPAAAYVPPCPGPGYTWIAGYWYPAGPRYYWRPGYWAARPYVGAYWSAPRYYGHRYYPGHWRR